MKITVKSEIKDAGRFDLLAAPLKKNGKALVTGKLDKRTADALSQLKKLNRLDGSAGKSATVMLTGKKPYHATLMGCGDVSSADLSVRKFAAHAVKISADNAANSVCILLDSFDDSDIEDTVTAAVEGVLLAGYRFNRYLTDADEKKVPDKVTLVIKSDHELKAARKGVKFGTIMSEATALGRDLVNEPAAEMTPAKLVETARSLASDNIKVKVMDRKKLESMGAEGILSVAKGSSEPPYMVHLRYTPNSKPKSSLALVGKGLTFDSGGLSIKPSDGMEDMKIDMAGSAAVLGVFSALDKLQPDVEVHGIAAFCENMPSGGAVRPGDVVRTMSGKTIEILNTDAEGRVTLADALHYASSLKPDYIVDIATLTGACVVALGQEVAGLFSNSDQLVEELDRASDQAGEMVWRLPMPAEYGELIKSEIADLRNTGKTRYGGAITAGMFLKNFVGDIPWAHLDIAGPSYSEKGTLPYQPKGGTGFSIRTMLRFLHNLTN